MSIASSCVDRLREMMRVEQTERLMSSAVIDNRLKRRAHTQGVPFKGFKRIKSNKGGIVKLKRMMDILRSFTVDGCPRNSHQVKLHLGMVGAVLHGMFRHDSESALRVAMQMFNIPIKNQLFAALAPRRFGKTKAVSMLVAAYALSNPGSVTAIFSTAQRASSLLLEDIKMLIESVPNCSFKIEKCNHETLVLREGKLLTKISSYPGRADT